MCLHVYVALCKLMKWVGLCILQHSEDIACHHKSTSCCYIFVFSPTSYHAPHLGSLATTNICSPDPQCCHFAYDLENLLKQHRTSLDWLFYSAQFSGDSFKPTVRLRGFFYSCKIFHSMTVAQFVLPLTH